ncbi:hypothetical protein ELQ90_09235 [Labedella phragmitis]|uniref:Uncharacterized protein n=1 Tax=Labedella phragmitis TaxID=2498849 RepID=A0A3S3Z8B1_9MICO|nr:hypothetical protein [Labedella phragmitis]RWZ50985.1 hypothetical protein ELQ90_09235 [Labedella phragmitis]
MRRYGRRRAGTVVASCAASAALLVGCSAGPLVAPNPNMPADTSMPSPSATDAGTVTPLDDGSYRAAVYVADGPVTGDVLAAGTLVDLGGGCLGLEAEDGRRSLVAFPAGTTLEDGVVSPIGMASFGLGQPLRYTGSAGSVDRPRSALALPEGCPADVADVWYFVVPASAGVDGPGDD